MPSQIAVLAPNPTIAARTVLVASELGMSNSVSVHDGHLRVALQRARILESAGVDVLVARGTSAESIIRSNVRTPLVEIPVSGQDLAKALNDAKSLTGMPHPRIALLAYAALPSDLEVFAGLLGISLTVYPIRGDENKILEQVRRAKADGAHIVVAGSVTAGIAAKAGMLSMPLDSGEASLRAALLDAKKIAYARKIEKAQVQRFKAVLETSRDGVLVIDEIGRVMLANASVRPILRLSAPPEGKAISDILLADSIRKCLSDGIPVLDEIVQFGDTPLLCSVTPTKLDNYVTGAVVVLQPIGAITALEAKIRKNLLAKGLVSQYSFNDILGVSPQMKKAVARARQFASTDSTVLLCGETGTGKELFAQAIHNASPRRNGPLVAVNCAALPPALLESELFGYEEGAFTGARRKGKPGLFELAHGGSIFLDEISEMDHYGQTRLLRVIQERVSMRLGGDKYIPVAARVIAASNRDLRAEVRAGRFREDLFYRLNVLSLVIPPLRERSGDVPHLAEHFATDEKKIYNHVLRLPPTVLERLAAHDWPGNVRELATVIERAALISETDTVTLACIEEALALEECSRETTRQPVQEGVEERQIVNALDQAGGSLHKAAAILGMHRSTLHRKMRALGLRKTATL